ncbi:MAG: long-chain fatty acid--CoA ligase, partial [candidate division NC10 bacterium]|nr:long-chain fatty acid--CoA ligase [candidate division NC10 bacterium]
MPRAGRPPEVEVTPELTIPKLFVRTAREYGQRVAIREKEFGMWRPITWAAYLENVRLFALGLTALGLQR